MTNLLDSAARALLRSPFRRLATWNPSMRQVIAISVVAVTMASAASVASAIALSRLGPQVTRIDKITQELGVVALSNFQSRRAATIDGCKQREDLKTDLRQILLRFGVTADKLPHRADGTVVLSPLAGGCVAYAIKTVPAKSGP